MNNLHIKPSKLQGSIAAPPSKSHTLRAILFAAMAKGESYIRNYLPSTDTQAMIEACRLLGATIESTGHILKVQGIDGKVEITDDVINAGNSGIVLRFIAAVASLSRHPIVITGDHSIRHQRPMAPLMDALSQLGVQAISTKGDGFAPIIVQGPVLPGKVNVDGTDSQPVSALLIAGSFASGPITIHVNNPGEKPWIDFTLDWMKRVGLPFERDGYRTFKLPGKRSIASFDYNVPGDWSSAAFPIAAALITGSELTIQNVDLDDCQGDKKLLNLFQQMGAKWDYDQNQKSVRVLKDGKLKGIVADINDFVDAVPVLAAVSCFAEGETLIVNAGIAKHKECDRLTCITSELSKMGAHISETADGLRIVGGALKVQI